MIQLIVILIVLLLATGCDNSSGSQAKQPSDSGGEVNTNTGERVSWTRLYKKAEQAISRGDLISAEIYSEQAWEHAQKTYPENSEFHAKNLSQLLQIYTLLGKSSEAIEIESQYLTVSQSQKGFNAVDHATLYHILGVTYAEKGDMNKAKEMFLKSISIVKEKEGRVSDKITISSYRKLAIMFSNNRQFDESTNYYQKMLNHSAKILDTQSQSNALRGIGWSHFNQFRNKEAEEYYLKSLNIVDRSDPVGQIEYANTSELLGRLYKAQGLYWKAVPHYLDAILIYEKMPKEDAVPIGELTHVLASSYHNSYNYAESLKWYEKSIKACKDEDNEKYLGINYIEYGKALKDAGKHKMAIQYLKIASEYYQNMLGKKNYLSTECERILIELYKEVGDTNNAEKLTNKLIQNDEI